MPLLSRHGEVKGAHFDSLGAGALIVLFSLWAGCAPGEEGPASQGRALASLSRAFPQAPPLIPSSPIISQPMNGQFLNDRHPTFSGTAEIGTLVQVFVNGAALGSSETGFDGSWSLASPVALMDGRHEVLAIAIDGDGNTSSSLPIDFTVDTVPPSPPVMTEPAADAWVNVSQLTFRGIAEPHSVVTVYVNGSEGGSSHVDSSGNWSLLSPVALPEGPNTVSASATDRAGNTSEQSAIFSFVVDTMAPPAPVVAAPAHGSWVSVVRPTFQGTADADTTLTLFVNGHSLGHFTPDITGQWQYTPSADLEDGLHAARVEARDRAGNMTPGESIAFTIDTVRPGPPAIHVPLCAKTLPMIHGAAEPLNLIRLYVDGAPQEAAVFANSQGEWSLQLTGSFSQGAHVVQATSTDAASNESNRSGPEAFILDAEPPEPPVVTSHGDGAVVNTARAVFRGTAEPHTSVHVFVDSQSACTIMGAASGTWECTVPHVLSEGLHQLSAVTEDCAGNRSPASTQLSFTMSRVSPQIGWPRNGGFVRDPLLVVEGTAEPGSSIEVVVDGGLVLEAQADITGEWSVPLMAALSEGTHMLTVTVTDTAGTPIATTVTFTVDTTPPETHFGGEAPQLEGSPPRAAFEFSSEAGATFECSLDGAAFTSCQSPLAFEELEDGEHTFSVRAKDSAGNVDPSPATASWSQSTAQKEEEERGGCSATSGAVPNLLAWLSLALLAARRRGGPIAHREVSSS